MRLSLSEEYVLLSLDDRQGSFSMYAGYGLVAAMLMDLLRRGRLAVEAGKASVIDSTPTGDPALDDLLAGLAGKPPKALSAWISQLGMGAGYCGAFARRLVDAGILCEEERRFLRLFPHKRYPEALHGPENEIVSRLRSVLLTESAADEATSALVALVEASGLMGVMLSREEKRRAHPRIQALTNASPVAKALTDALSDDGGASAAALVCSM